MRRTDREVREFEDILKIIEKAKILRLGLFDGVYPYIVPLHFGYTYDSETKDLIFYMHSAKEGHKLDLIRDNPNVCIELDADVEVVSGGDVPCRYGASFSSVIARGSAEILENPEEKVKGLERLMLHQTGRSFEISEQMALSVEVVKVKVLEITAKERKKPKDF